MFKIRITYYETIYNKDVTEAVGIMFINCVKIIGCFLENKNIENFITPFVVNMLFRNIGLFWIIQSNKNLSSDFQKHFSSWILNVPQYNNNICSQLHGLVFGDYFKTAKRDKYILMYYIQSHGKIIKQSTSTNL